MPSETVLTLRDVRYYRPGTIDAQRTEVDFILSFSARLKETHVMLRDVKVEKKHGTSMDVFLPYVKIVRPIENLLSNARCFLAGQRSFETH